MKCLMLSFLALTFGFVALATAEEKPAKPEEQGLVTEAGNGAFLVGKSARVRVDAKTEILVRAGKEDKVGKFEDIKVGAKVMVWYDGPVAESFPTQGKAKKVIVIPQVEEKK